MCKLSVTIPIPGRTFFSENLMLLSKVKLLYSFQNWLSKLYIGGPVNVPFGCRTIFLQLFLPYAIIYYNSHHLEDVSNFLFQPLQSAHVTSGLRIFIEK